VIHNLFLSGVAALLMSACLPPTGVTQYKPEGTLMVIMPGVLADLFLATSDARAMAGLVEPNGATLSSGCVLDVLRTVSADLKYARVARCDFAEPAGPIDPKTGLKPTRLKIYDGWVGYVQTAFLRPYDGAAVFSRS
jgi:hypothetical protein